MWPPEATVMAPVPAAPAPPLPPSVPPLLTATGPVPVDEPAGLPAAISLPPPIVVPPVYVAAERPGERQPAGVRWRQNQCNVGRLTIFPKYEPLTFPSMVSVDWVPPVLVMSAALAPVVVSPPTRWLKPAISNSVPLLTMNSVPTGRALLTPRRITACVFELIWVLPV